MSEQRQRRYRRLWDRKLGRRQFLAGTGAVAAVLAGCSAPRSVDFVPYVHQPEDVVPGKKLPYATSLAFAGYGRGAVAVTHEGRPTKIEGNPNHPASMGASDVWMQASLHDLYDPDRAQLVLDRNSPSTWNRFLEAALADLDLLRARGGQGLAILTGTVTSPAFAAQLQALRAALPAASWHAFEPMNADFEHAGTQFAFARPLDAQYRFDRADIVVALDSDFLATDPASLRYARDFSSRRRLTPRRSQAQAAASLNRLYVIETFPSITGAVADHRLPVKPSDVEGFARALATAVGVPGVPPPPRSGFPDGWLDAVTTDLLAHRGTSIVIAGNQQPPVVHALAHAMNVWLQNVNLTVTYTAPIAAGPTDQRASLARLVADMRAGRIDTLYILGTNPAYAAPASLGFADALARVRSTVRLGLYDDETAQLCRWRLPMSHELETWGDIRAYDGTVSIVQPTIEPLYDTRSPLELVASLVTASDAHGQQLVHSYWKGSSVSADFDRFWERTVREGVMHGTAELPVTVTLRSNLTFLPQTPLAAPPRPAASRPPSSAPGDGAADRAAKPAPAGGVHLSSGAASGMELAIRFDPTILDGQYASNGWLQELPKPMSKIVWDNAVFVGPGAAERMGLAGTQHNLPGSAGESLGVIADQLRGREVMAIAAGEAAIELPVYVIAGHPDDCATVHLGYGRRAAGSRATGRGSDAYRLLPSGFPGAIGSVALTTTGRNAFLALGQHAATDHGRDEARSGTLAEYRATPDFARKAADRVSPPDLYPPPQNDVYRWAMSIDLSACIGCNACVVACVAENNEATVGYDQMLAGRDMHWLRIDRYFRKDRHDPEIALQPVPCQQCEHAPCEIVCPVEATVHSSEGLNDMVYNRCIGTRYCSNNCPYKVRRFNFLQYADYGTPVVQLRYNPEVTVRSRGVMEKCTYCVQRINDARMRAQEEGRRVRDGEVEPACAQACPTEAIVFGNLNDPHSLASRLRHEPLTYGLLSDLLTKPRTTYLARIRNPNPVLSGQLV